MIRNEAIVFLAMTVCGLGLSLLFDMFRAIRITFKSNKAVSAFTDIIFWIIAGAAVIVSVWNFNSGIFRIYEPVGMILGAIFYFLLLSKCFLKIFLFIIKNILIIVRFILKILLTPPLFLYKILVVPIITSISTKRRKGHGTCNE